MADRQGIMANRSRKKVDLMVQGTFDWDRILDELIEVDDTRCDVCGNGVEIVHCKIVCKSCGNVRDCSDP